MKLNIQRNAVVVSDDFKSMDFGIRSCDMGIILETLRSKMYKNPIGAICREIASNSRDANREVGKSKLPIRIQIDKDMFNPGETTLSFIDDGPGIDEERVAEIFVNYGASTKRGTNRLTGAFGFGSKTPFAYSDSFSVVTKVDGMKYIYVAAIEENNTGKIYLFNKVETNEPNGTAIVIPIKKEDIQIFESECVKATWFWEPKPQYINFRYIIDVKMDVTPYDGELFVKQDGRELYPEYYYLLIDGIPYDVSGGNLKLPDVRSYKKAFFLIFKTGQLTISANRESVQYDNHTIKTIKSRYEKLWMQFKGTIQEKIEACPNSFEARLVIVEHRSHPLFDHLTTMGEHKFTYKGQPISPLFQFQKIKISRIDKNGKVATDYVEPGMRKGFYFVKTVLFQGRTRALLQMGAPPEEFFVVEIPKEVRGFGKKTFAERKKLARVMRNVLIELSTLKEMGITFHQYSDVTPVKVMAAKEEVQEKDKKIFVRMETGRYGGNWRKIDEIRKDSLYVIVSKNDEFVNQWISFIHENYKINVVMVAKCYEKYFTGKFQTLKDYLKNIDKSKLQIYSDYKFMMDKKIQSSYEFLKCLKIPELSEWDVKLIETIRNKGYYRYTLPSNFYTIAPVGPDIKLAMGKLEKVFKKYPLLCTYNKYNTITNNVITKDYQQYIDGINTLNKEAENADRMDSD